MYKLGVLTWPNLNFSYFLTSFSGKLPIFASG
nr:MAG TPA: hypothetical protein [Microviridae sp.]